MNAPVKITSSNPYLNGNFAPVHSEDDFADLKVTGEIPKGLAGAFFRNGPNPQFAPRDDFHHWFAGDGMIHGVYVADGKARYRNRYVRIPSATAHESGIEWVMCTSSSVNGPSGT